MIYLIAAALVWAGLIAGGLVYNARRRSQRRCANMACSRQSTSLERVTVPSRVEGTTLTANLCPDCWALYRRWASGE